MQWCCKRIRKNLIWKLNPLFQYSLRKCMLFLKSSLNWKILEFLIKIGVNFMADIRRDIGMAKENWPPAIFKQMHQISFSKLRKSYVQPNMCRGPEICQKWNFFTDFHFAPSPTLRLKYFCLKSWKSYVEPNIFVGPEICQKWNFFTDFHFAPSPQIFSFQIIFPKFTSLGLPNVKWYLQIVLFSFNIPVNTKYAEFGQHE